MKTIDPTTIPAPEFYRYLTASVAPRPIAFASTIDRDGRVNLSPFSFFNVFGSNPGILVFSPVLRGRDGSAKDTLLNVQEVPEVVVNLVSYAMVEQASLASSEYARGVNEFVKAGFTEVPSERVRPPRVGESPVQLECRVRDVIETNAEAPGSANLVIAEVLLAHVAEELLDERGFIDPRKTDWVGRLGGDWYVRTSGAALFEVARPRHGIGIDQLPQPVRESTILTGNDLGKLGNVETLPEPDAAVPIPPLASTAERHRYAQRLLAQNRVPEAWQVLLREG
jgi:flavin reductase (DIM6/NTAB) family NADH-FMN oxidoreductase RutF